MSVEDRPPATRRRKEILRTALRFPLWWIPVLFALSWAMYALLRRPVGDYAVETDFFGDYVPWSREWMTGHPSAMNGFKGPIYYLLLGLCSRLVTVITPGGYPPPPGVEFAIGKAFSVVSAGLILVLAGKVALGLSWRPAGETGSPALFRAVFPALLVQIVVATNVDFIDHSYRAATDLVALALTMAAIWQGLRAGGRRSCLVAGVLAGLAYLVRYSNVVLLPGIVGLVMLTALPRRGRCPEGGSASGQPGLPTRWPGGLSAKWRRGLSVKWQGGLSARWQRGLSVLAGFVVVSLPWWLFLWGRTGNPFYNRNPLNGAFEVFGRGVVSYESFMSAGLPFDSSWLDLLRADAARTLHVWLGNLPAHLWYDLTGLLGWPVALLTLGGWAAALLRSTNRRPWILLASLLALYSLVNVPIFYGKRFALPMLPFYAFGVTALACVVPGRMISRRWITVVLPCLAVLCFLGGQFRGVILAENPSRFFQPREVLVLRDVLAQKGIRLDPAALLASRKSHAAYWLGVRATGLPEGEVLSTILDELRRRGARYLYVGSSEITLRPALETLANPARLQQRIDGLNRLGAGMYYWGERITPGVLYEIEARGEPDSALTEAEAGPEGGEHPVPEGVSRQEFVRFSLGKFYLQQGVIESAAPLLQKAARSAPGWRAAQEWAGDAALFGKDAGLAESYYQAALRIDPSAPTAASRLAALRLLKDQPAEAAEILQRVLESPGGSHARESGSRGTLGEVGRRFYAEGEYGAAWAPLMGAVTADSTDWRSQTDLGFIARNILSDRALGRVHLSAAVRHMPSGPERNRLESLLQGTGPASR